MPSLREITDIDRGAWLSIQILVVAKFASAAKEIADAFKYDLGMLALRTQRLSNALSDLKIVCQTQEKRYKTYQFANKEQDMKRERIKFKQEVMDALRETNVCLVSIGLNSLDINIDRLVNKWKDEQEK